MTQQYPAVTASRAPSAGSGRRLWIEATTLGDLLDRQAATNDGFALVFPDERVTFPELAARAQRYAQALRGLGVGPQDKVGLLLSGGVDYFAALFAVVKLGAIAVPINARFKSFELSHVVRSSDMRVLIVDEASEAYDYPALLLEAFPALERQDPSRLRLDGAPHLERIVVWGDEAPGGFLSRLEFEAAARDVDADDVDRLQSLVRVRDTAVIMYTSGTTAAPKGALIPHEALVRQVHAIARTRFMLGPDDRIWTPLPLFHIGGMAFCLTAISAGVPFCHPGLFTPEGALHQIEQVRATIALPGFETIWLPVVKHPRFAEFDFSALRVVVCVGVKEHLREMQEILPRAILLSTFAMTEGASYISLNRLDDDLEARLTTGGHPLPGIEVRVVDPETSRPSATGALGEIHFRGAARFDGYYGEPELTSAVIDSDGWFRSGDLGTMDADGRVTFVSRLKDMLKVGGENVAAAETEDFLAQHPSVSIVQVVAAPDARYGEVPAAFVALNDGAEVTERELIDFCRGKIATFKVPRYVRFVTDWPMSGTKIKKHVLRELIADELKASGVVEAPRIASRDGAAQ